MPHMVKKSGEVERVKTNIPGFDETIHGGLVKNSLNLLAGGPGSGKTIFCLQFIYNGIQDFNEHGLVISFDESYAGMIGDGKQFGWDFDELQKNKKCVFLAFQPFDHNDIKTEISKAIKNYNVKRVVIDSLSVFSIAFKDDAYRLRKEFYRLATFLKDLDCTVIVTSEVNGEAPLDITSAGNSLTRDVLIEYVADSVITMHNSGIGGEADRAIRAVKMRRTNHRRDPIPMKITEKGIVMEG